MPEPTAGNALLAFLLFFAATLLVLLLVAMARHRSWVASALADVRRQISINRERLDSHSPVDDAARQQATDLEARIGALQAELRAVTSRVEELAGEIRQATQVAPAPATDREQRIELLLEDISRSMRLTSRHGVRPEGHSRYGQRIREERARFDDLAELEDL